MAKTDRSALQQQKRMVAANRSGGLAALLATAKSYGITPDKIIKRMEALGYVQGKRDIKGRDADGNEKVIKRVPIWVFRGTLKPRSKGGKPKPPRRPTWAACYGKAKAA